MCKHHWLYPEQNGYESNGVCRDCGAKKVSFNSDRFMEGNYLKRGYTFSLASNPKRPMDNDIESILNPNNQKYANQFGRSY